MVESFIWTFVGAALSALIASFPSVGRYFRHKRRPELLGNWRSSYQGIDEPSGTWVTEDVHVRQHFGTLIFKNSNSSQRYDYTARCQLVEKCYLVGNWESIRPGANAYGAHLLTISAQGNCLYGYWCGPDQAGSRRYGRWVLARDKKGLGIAKELLDAMRHPIEITRSS
jgi:hypothetical protein